MLKLYRIDSTGSGGYDTYDSAVVCAKSKKAATKVHPSRFYSFGDDGNVYFEYADGTKRNQGLSSSCWCRLDQVEVTYIGIAGKDVKEGDVICSSFNAG